jgi:hypothetical protein
VKTATELLTEAVSKSDAGSSITDFIDAVVYQFGGPLGMATELRLEWAEHPRGSPAHLHILDGILKLLERYGTEAEANVEKLEDLRDELAALPEEDDL